MFAALALGAPVGTTLYAMDGFAAVALATTVVPLVTLLLVIALPRVPPQRGTRPALVSVAGAVWMPGLGAAFSSIGFGAIVAFSSLLFANRGLEPGLARLQRFCCFLDCRPCGLRSCARHAWAGSNCARLRVHRSGRSRSHLAGGLARW
jgi:hypothetical protein